MLPCAQDNTRKTPRRSATKSLPLKAVSPPADEWAKGQGARLYVCAVGHYRPEVRRMLQDLLNQELDHRLSWASKIDEVYGVKVNALTVDELFELYRRTGFLSPAKGARLLRYMTLVRENMRRLILGRYLLFYLLTDWRA